MCVTRQTLKFLWLTFRIALLHSEERMCVFYKYSRSSLSLFELWVCIRIFFLRFRRCVPSGRSRSSVPFTTSSITRCCSDNSSRMLFRKTLPETRLFLVNKIKAIRSLFTSLLAWEVVGVATSLSVVLQWLHYTLHKMWAWYTHQQNFLGLESPSSEKSIKRKHHSLLNNDNIM